MKKNRAGLLAVFSLVAILWWMFFSCGAPEKPRDVGSVLEEGRRANVMLLATNHEEGLDAALLVSYEPLSGQLVIFHVPATLCLDGTVEDSSPRKEGVLPMTLESAVAKEPFDRLNQKLQKYFGPELSFTAVMPTQKFFRLIDLMGGVFVDVPARISFHSARETRTFDNFSERIEIPGGDDVFFDSDKTRMYLSYRFDGLGVRGQMFRARRLAAAVIHRLKAHLEYEWFRGELQTCFSHGSAESALQLFKQLSAVPSSSIDVQLLPGIQDINSGVYWVSRNALKNALPRELKPLIQAGLPKSRILVQLLNGSGAPNIAAKLREQLSAYPDVDIVEMGNADRRDYETTRIIDRGGHLRSAERIHDLIGAGVLSQEINPKALLDVTVIIGKDYK